MVNWKSGDADFRLLAAIFGANPTLKIDIEATATLYGRDASVRALHNQITKIRKLGKELADEAQARGAQIPQGTPRTPRESRTPRTTTGSGSSRKSSGGVRKRLFNTPSKQAKIGASMVDPIIVDSGDDSDVKSIKSDITIARNMELKAEEIDDDVPPKKEHPVLLTPFPKPSDDVFGTVRMQRVQSQTNGHADTPVEGNQAADGGYDVNAFFSAW